MNDAVLAERGRTVAVADLESARAAPPAHPDASPRARSQRLCERRDRRQPAAALRDRRAPGLAPHPDFRRRPGALG